MIKATDIHKSYGALEVLRGVSLDVSRGEVVSIVGASGAGKTTLLQILGTLSKADRGSVEIDGQDVSSLGDRALSRFRNEKIGFVFQFHHLLPEFTAFENVCIPGLIGRRPIGLDEVTPWSHMDYGVTHEYLVREYNKALAAQTTQPCNRACHGCGANHLLGGPCFDYSQNLV